jgi:hypothetical protein
MSNMSYRPVTTDPPVSIDDEGLTRRVATFCKAQGITNDAGWATAVSTAFNGVNASGLSANTRTFMTEFFTNFIKVG